MKVNFILPFLNKTGGVMVVLRHAANLSRMGHDVKVYHPLWPYGSLMEDIPGGPRRLYHKFRRFITAARRPARSLPWFPDAAVEPVISISSYSVRDADATVATAWPTAYSVAGLPASKGAKYYFIQDYEKWFKDIGRVDGSYRLPLSPIVIAPWLRDLLADRFGRRAAGMVHNGVDLEAFRRPASKPQGPPGILMMCHILESKGTADGMDALRRLRDGNPGVKVRLFGMHAFDAPDWAEYHRDPAADVLAALYRDSHIFVCSSQSEGWGLPVMEAMASGCAVVASDVGCVPVLKDGRNMLVYPPRDRDALHGHLERLVRDASARDDIAERGWRTVQERGWKDSSRAFERVLTAGAAGHA